MKEVTDMQGVSPKDYVRLYEQGKITHTTEYVCHACGSDCLIIRTRTKREIVVYCTCEAGYELRPNQYQPTEVY